jgi:hypothetical protein
MTLLHLTYRKLALWVTVSLLFFIGLNAQEPHPLDTLLAEIPQQPAFTEMIANTISFADYRAAERAAGLAPVTSRDAYDALPDDQRAAWEVALLRVHAGPNSFVSLADQHIAAMPDLLGFGYFDADAGLTYGFDPFTGTLLHSIDGDFSATATAAALRARNYEQRTTAVGTAWGRGGDGQTDINNLVMGDPFGGDVGLASRVQVIDPNTVMNTFTWEILFVAAEAQAGNAPTLADDPAYTTMAAALTADEATLIQALILSPPAATLQTPSADLGTLPIWAVAAAADLQDGDQQVHRLLLLYNEADDAQTAAAALPGQVAAFDQGWLDTLGFTVDVPTTTEVGDFHLVTLAMHAPAPTPQDVLDDGAYTPGIIFGFWATALRGGRFHPFALVPPSD